VALTTDVLAGLWFQTPRAVRRARGFVDGFRFAGNAKTGGQTMALYKFVIGQAVDFNSKLPWMSGGPYEVVSVLPVDERDSPTYRVKSKAEPFARAAKESDLVAVGLPSSKQPAPVRWVDLLPRPPGPSRSR
jgi:hypothetical protein